MKTYNQVIEEITENLDPENPTMVRLFSEEKYEECLVKIEEILGRNKDDWITLLKKSEVYMKLGRFDEAIVVLDYILNNVEETFFITWLFRAQCYDNIGNDEEVVRSCSVIYDIWDPSIPRLWEMFCLYTFALLKTKQYELASEILKVAIKHQKQNEVFYYLLAITEDVAGKKDDALMMYLETRERLDPSSNDYYKFYQQISSNIRDLLND